jgi:protease I
MGKLGRMRVAVIVADGFEQSELDVPVKALRDAGVAVDVLAPDEAHHEHIKGEAKGQETAGVKPDRLLRDANPEMYDGLLIPGGVQSPMWMRASGAHLAWVRRMFERGRPVAAICHGPWLISASDMASGRMVTSHPDCRADLEAAGARWVDQQVVVDRGLVTSRKPEDLAAFCREFLALLEREYTELACPPSGIEQMDIGVVPDGRTTSPSIL